MDIEFSLDPERNYTLNYIRADDEEPDSIRFTKLYYAKIIDGHLFLYDKFILVMAFIPGRWRSLVCRDKIYYPDL